MTYFSRATYTAGGSEFNIVGNWLNQDNIVVTVAGVTMVNGVDYTINATTNKFTLTTPVASGVAVTVERATPLADDALEVTFSDGSFLDANSLNRASLQNCYQNQELRDDLTTISGEVSSLSSAFTALETTVNAFDARITSLEAQIGTGGSLVPISRGGTNATTAADARTNLGLGSMAIQDASNVAITGGTISGVSLSISLDNLSANNLSLSNSTIHSLTDPLAIVDGGTGHATAVTAFDALSPLTTKGDLVTFNGTNNVRLGVGTNDYVLTADSTATNGIAWKAATGGSATVVRGVLGGHSSYVTITTTGSVVVMKCASLTENYGSWYDSSTGYFTPNVAGRYLLSLCTRLQNNTGSDNIADCILFLNGTAIANATLAAKSGSYSSSFVSVIKTFNGSTDYAHAGHYLGAQPWNITELPYSYFSAQFLGPSS